MQKISPFLWFDNQAEEAANFYVSIFKDSKIKAITRYDEEGAKTADMPAGAVMTVAFLLGKQEFTALNGGPQFKFTEAISFLVSCKNQEEVDELWDKLGAGGEPGKCGWLKDRYGLFWQIVPATLNKLLGGKDHEKARRVMKAMLEMDKLDIKVLQRAAKGDE